MDNPTADLSTFRQLISQVKQVEIDEDHLSLETRFAADLGMKSLEIVGLVFMCEQTFGVSLVTRPGLLVKLQTVGEAVEAIRLMQNGLWVDAVEDTFETAEALQ